MDLPEETIREGMKDHWEEDSIPYRMAAELLRKRAEAKDKPAWAGAIDEMKRRTAYIIDAIKVAGMNRHAIEISGADVPLLLMALTRAKASEAEGTG